MQVKALLASRAARLGRPVVVTSRSSFELATHLDLEQQRHVLGLLADHEGKSLMFAPVGLGRELLGYVLLARDDGSPWSDDEQDAVMEVGRTLGRVVLNARLYDRERHLVGELQELDRYKGELIATISHELKTPLTSIIGHIELLEDLDVADDRGQRRLQLVRDGRDQLALVAVELLELADQVALAVVEPGVEHDAAQRPADLDHRVLLVVGPRAEPSRWRST